LRHAAILAGTDGLSEGDAGLIPFRRFCQSVIYGEFGVLRFATLFIGCFRVLRLSLAITLRTNRIDRPDVTSPIGAWF
jgi:hypothetical protein